MQEWVIQIRLSWEDKKERKREIERERLRTKLVGSWFQKVLGEDNEYDQNMYLLYEIWLSKHVNKTKNTYYKKHTNFLKSYTIFRVKTESIFIFKISFRFGLFLCHYFKINEHIAKPTIKKIRESMNLVPQSAGFQWLDRNEMFLLLAD